MIVATQPGAHSPVVHAKRRERDQTDQRQPHGDLGSEHRGTDGRRQLGPPGAAGDQGRHMALRRTPCPGHEHCQPGDPFQFHEKTA